MAHAKVQREKRRQAAKEAAEGQAKAASGWLGWLRGGAAAGTEAKPGGAAGAGQVRSGHHQCSGPGLQLMHQ